MTPTAGRIGMRNNSKATIRRRVGLPGALAIAIFLSSAQCASAASAAVAPHVLQQQQLQDSLDLDLRQSVPRRADMSPTDTLRLDQLQLRQRLEQQQLEQQQLQQERSSRNRDFPNAVVQERRFAQERQLQLQRFDAQQRELVRSIKPQPLQRSPSAGNLLP
jgi:hypothetical protein